MSSQTPDTRKPDVIVIGSGLHGCSTALHLSMRGVKVLVLEKDHVARHASGVNAGGVRQLGRHVAEVPLTVASMALWHRIGELVDDDCGFESHGQLKVAESEAELAGLEARAAELRALGFGHEEVIGQAELRALVPAIADHCVGALISRGDGAAIPFRTTFAFRRKAIALGARFEEGAGVARVSRSGGVWSVETTAGDRHEAPVLVNCAGAWADRIAAQLGEPVPLEVIAPMLMITARVPPFIKPVVGAAGRTLSFKQFPNGTVLIGGGLLGHAVRDENRTELDFSQVSVNARTVWDLFPVMRGATIVRSWAGIEARMPDQIPVIGPSGTQPGVFHAFGFSAHGFQLGPIVGRITADLITAGATDLPIDAFRIGRFAA
ncbi:NAD(P)/FAD-dependent oxidoreductase [Azospirillum doebereinerae]|uniref:FAD-binding oxidoreductase n=1 Tax=Azospirillum doebereinerae TaxID=92933 RepID=A0A433J108_9PROT|nr:FAD-dependent oxidoreductase [Azospirillum doebereinerae]MCG5240483.1 FAD-binding oxidoreductase [Azospirillum doebereinerae]RUQ63709.1 FAD-binding oxidoreductase [Azospirillum doebereinerae]